MYTCRLNSLGFDIHVCTLIVPVSMEEYYYRTWVSENSQDNLGGWGGGVNVRWTLSFHSGGEGNGTLQQIYLLLLYTMASGIRFNYKQALPKDVCVKIFQGIYIFKIFAAVRS